MSEAEKVRIETKDVIAFVASEYAEAFDPAWFSPDSWGDRAEPVSAGGRGSAWFVLRPERDWVLRHYRRGGLMARFNERAYFYSGEGNVRSFSEFQILQDMAGMGLPVPRPIAAGYRRQGLFYSASIIVERLTDVVPLGELLRGGEDSSDIWARVGRVLRQFHDAGVFHADLNCFNILVGKDKVYLIDFDRGEFRQSSIVAGTGWKERNLSRLKRSAVKLLEKEGAIQQHFSEFWATLLAAYRE